MQTMTPLCEIAERRTCDKGPTFHGYTPIYDRLFSTNKERATGILEIGVQFGCSVGMWLEYFTAANIYGVDIVNCHGDAKLGDNPRWKFFQADQRDRTFWGTFRKTVPALDIVIDDGCHHADAVKVSFECLWPHLKSGGIYVIEDVHAWWDREFFSPVWGPNFVRDLFGAVNWSGKSYCGKPNPVPYTLSELEKTVDFVNLTKGLIVIGKKA